MLSLICKVADPHHFNADLDPPFHLSLDPDSVFHFNADPDQNQDPHSTDHNTVQPFLEFSKKKVGARSNINHSRPSFKTHRTDFYIEFVSFSYLYVIVRCVRD
jgi:hypothetical protein